MTDKDIRLECLRLACAVAHDGNAAAEIAKAFEAFVIGLADRQSAERRPDIRAA